MITASVTQEGIDGAVDRVREIVKVISTFSVVLRKRYVNVARNSLRGRGVATSSVSSVEVTHVFYPLGRVLWAGENAS